MPIQDPDFEEAPAWLIRLIHIVIIVGGLILAGVFFYALLQLP